jgi:C_GCAxxG_C_C family probable redox protein
MFGNVGDKAVELFDSGFNCAESVLLALSRDFNEPAEHIIPCIATGFGGGIARTGSTCGALSGAIMTIGLIIGPRKAEELEKKEEVYDMALKMIENFEKEFGSSLCKNLTKCDLRTLEGHEKFQSQKIRETVCPKFVKWAVNYATRLMETR